MLTDRLRSVLLGSALSILLFMFGAITILALVADRRVHNVTQSQSLKGLVHSLGAGESKDRQKAAELLGKLGGTAKEAIPELELSLKDVSRPVRIEAAEALLRIDPFNCRAIDALTELLKDNGDDRSRIISLLPYGGPRALPALVRLTKDREASTRAFAAQSIGDIGMPNPVCISALIVSLDDPEEQVVIQSVQSLRRFGAAARPAVPHMVELLNEQNPDLFLQVIQALGDIQTCPDDVIPALEKVLTKSRHPDARCYALQSLSLYGEKAHAAVETVIQVLQEEKRRKVKQYAMICLGKLGARSILAIPALKEQLANEDDLETRQICISTFGEIGEYSEDVGSGLIIGLNDDIPTIRRQSIAILLRLRIKSKIVIHAIRKCIDDADPLVREYAKKAMNVFSREKKEPAKWSG